MSFFSTPENLEALRFYSRTLRNHTTTNKSNDIAKSLLNIIELIIQNASRFDELCSFNIEWIGESFMQAIREFPGLSDNRKEEAIETDFTSAYRFLCELEFTQPAEPSMEIRQIGRFIDENLQLFTGNDRQQITFARYAMPVQIAKKLLNDPAIADFRKFSQTVEEATKLKADWDTDLEQRRKHVESIKDGLKGLTSAYNFVGLVNGFRQLAQTKSTERRVAFWSLIALALLMILPPAIQIGYVLQNIDSIDSKRGLLLYTLPTIITIEVLLVYLFRVVLSQFKSVKAQLLQIDLRIALCQFIQSYAEYSAKIKKDDPSTLTKFESVVFSSLVPENENIPSTFDGAEQLANLIKSIRGTQ